MADAHVTLEPMPFGAEWDAAVAPLPGGHFLHSSTWLGFKARQGWRAKTLCLTSGGEPLAYLGILTRRLARVLTVAYLPRGPLLVQRDRGTLMATLATLESLAQRRHWLFVKVDPDTWPPESDAVYRPVLEERGWRRAEPVQFRNTVELSLEGSEDDLLGRMKPKTRYNVRLAERRGVQVRALSAQEIPLAYELYRETANRDGFIVRPRWYYEQLWAQLMAEGMGTVLLAEAEGRPLATLVAVAFGDTCWYLHGASADEGRNLMPTYLLQWEAMRWARAQGGRRYDLWGAPESPDDPDDSMAGVLRFKQGFGGELLEGLGAYDYAPHALPYRVYLAGAARLLDVGRALRRRGMRHER